MRQTERFEVEGPNSLWQLYQTVSFFKVMKNFVVIQLARYTPILPVKNWLYRTFLKMHVGKETSFALMVMVDLMFPERITVGQNSIIGYNTTILTHEYLVKEYRLGHVTIGDEVMIGANCTILPGVTIGNGATVAAGTIVSKDIPAYAFAKGNPVMITETKIDGE
jgi:acetyltransferase-like isoleucine patch superfamily enzyme